MTLGERIKQRRQELGLSQNTLAKRIGVTQGTISQMESGVSQNSTKIVDISNALNVSPEYLLYGKNPPRSPIKATSTLSDDELIASQLSDVAIKKSYLQNNQWDPEYIEFIKSPDESMSPTINIFDDVAINRLETTLHENGVFAIQRSSGITVIRRIILDFSQKWIYRCDNLDKTRFSDVAANTSDIILGRVIWRGGSNSLNF